MLLIALKPDRFTINRVIIQRVLRMLLIALKPATNRGTPDSYARIAHAINSVETRSLELLVLLHWARIAHAINSVETFCGDVGASDNFARIAHAINSVETHVSPMGRPQQARIAHAINSVETHGDDVWGNNVKRVLRMLLIALKLFGMNNFKHNCARIAHAINSIETNQNTVACSEKMARIAHAINSVETHPCSGRQSLVRAYCACY